MIRYRESTGAGINDAFEALVDRKAHLQRDFPERFKSDDDYHREAWSALESVMRPIEMIEASWDWDSHGPHIKISSITAAPSQWQPKYTEHCLYTVSGLDRQVERAIEFGSQLAEAARTSFYITDIEDRDDTKRWWDSQAQ